jgi:hypothetical protein
VQQQQEHQQQLGAPLSSSAVRSAEEKRLKKKFHIYIHEIKINIPAISFTRKVSM